MGFAGKLFASFGVEGCVVFDRQGIGLAGTDKTGASSSLGAGFTVGDFYAHMTIEGLTTKPGTWDAYVGVEVEAKGVGGSAYVVTDNKGNIMGGGYGATFGVSKRMSDAAKDQSPVGITAERGRTKSVRLRNPVSWFQEKTSAFVWSSYHPGG